MSQTFWPGFKSLFSDSKITATLVNTLVEVLLNWSLDSWFLIIGTCISNSNRWLDFGYLWAELHRSPGFRIFLDSGTRITTSGDFMHWVGTYLQEILLNRLFKQVENSLTPLFFFVWNKERISLSFNLIILNYFWEWRFFRNRCISRQSGSKSRKIDEISCHATALNPANL